MALRDGVVVEFEGNIVPYGTCVVRRLSKLNFSHVHPITDNHDSQSTFDNVNQSRYHITKLVLFQKHVRWFVKPLTICTISNHCKSSVLREIPFMLENRTLAVKVEELEKKKEVAVLQ